MVFVGVLFDLVALCALSLALVRPTARVFTLVHACVGVGIRDLYMLDKLQWLLLFFRTTRSKDVEVVIRRLPLMTPTNASQHGFTDDCLVRRMISL